MEQISITLLLLLLSTSAFSQAWVDTTLYPFEHRYLRLDAGKMHYVDEGKGPIILFVHGTPTWSFLYRDFIKELSKEYRCIAIDHLGFGLSDKPESVPGTPEWHAQNLNEFIQKLDLTDITLVVHDFGGPIGLSAAIQHHKKIKQVVLFNTWLWETKNNTEAKKVDNMVNSWLGKFLYVRMNISPKVLLKRGISDKKNLSREVHRQYLSPFLHKKSRVFLLSLAKALVGSSDWYQEQWMLLETLDQKSWLILWGTKDEFISTESLKKWEARLPHAQVKLFECGHFVQEEKAAESVNAIRSFMAK